MRTRSRSMVATAVIAGGLAFLTLWNLLSTPGDTRTDQHAERIVAELLTLRDDSAMGLARGLMNSDQAHGVSVLQATDRDLKAETTADVRPLLVIRIHEKGSYVLWGSLEPVTACYILTFDTLRKEPERIHCPEIRPILPTTPPRVDEPDYDIALDDVLVTLPEEVTETDIRDALRHAGLLAPPHGSDRGPDVDIRVHGTDFAVSVGAGRRCVLATRRDGEVEVWDTTASCRPTGLFGG